MARSLGRAYPVDVANTIRSLSESIDNLMAGSVQYEMLTDSEVASKIGDLNVRMVNNVILPFDRLSDDDVRARLLEIQKNIYELETAYRGMGIPLTGYPPVATVQETVMIPMAQADELLARLRQAYDLYPSVVDRYGAVRQAAVSYFGLPGTGPQVAAMLSKFDQAMSMLDQDVVWVRDALQALGDLTAAGGESISMDRSSFDRMRNWSAGVLKADEALKRIEGFAARKSAEPTPSPSARKSWGIYAVVGLALVGAAWWAISDK